MGVPNSSFELWVLNSIATAGSVCPCKEGAWASIVGGRGTKEMTVKANNTRMPTPISVIIDCLVCILFISISLLRANLSVSVQPYRSELSFQDRNSVCRSDEQSARNVPFPLILFWRGFSHQFPRSFWADASGNRRAKFEGWRSSLPCRVWGSGNRPFARGMKCRQEEGPAVNNGAFAMRYCVSDSRRWINSASLAPSQQPSRSLTAEKRPAGMAPDKAMAKTGGPLRASR